MALPFLRDHRWCELGMGFERGNDEFRQDQWSARATTKRSHRSVLNASSNDVAVVDVPGGRSLALVTDGTGRKSMAVDTSRAGERFSSSNQCDRA